MKRVRLQCDYVIEDKKDFSIAVIPKGMILRSAYGGGMFTTDNEEFPMTIGSTWVENNPHVFKEVE